MPRLPRRSISCALFALSCVAWPAAAATTTTPFVVEGSVAVSEPHGCDDPDLEKNSTVTWTECHALKGHVDATGQPITADAFDASALRALAVTIEVEAWCSYQNGTAGDASPRVTVSVQTDSQGRFQAAVPAFQCGASLPADGVVTRTTARLLYAIRDAGGASLGTVRAVWVKSKGMTVYNSVISADEPVLFTRWGEDYVIPRLMLDQARHPLPLPAAYNLGPQVFYQGAAPYAYPYLRGALGAWQTVIGLHTRLKDTLEGEGYGHLYPRIFVDDFASACATCYSVEFVNPFPGGTGGPGGFSLEEPNPALTMDSYGGLVSVGLPAHEFGHSMHLTIAARSFFGPDDTMHATQDPQGNIGGFHIPYVAQGVLQQQEMFMAFVEGFGNAMGGYFLNGCRIPDRGWGDADPKRNMWSPSAHQGCDGVAPLCPFESFRLQMAKRGIAEGSATWNDRLARLDNLARHASSSGAVFVTSNNELKYRNFFCDLLDKDPDASFATGRIGGLQYVPDYTWQAAEILDGRRVKPTLSVYAADPADEHVQLPLGALLEAMDHFVPQPLNYIPQGLWVPGFITDGANADYNDIRISVNGVVSPQALGAFLAAKGYATKAELNDIFRANRMEELP